MVGWGLLSGACHVGSSRGPLTTQQSTSRAAEETLTLQIFFKKRLSLLRVTQLSHINLKQSPFSLTQVQLIWDCKYIGKIPSPMLYNLILRVKSIIFSLAHTPGVATYSRDVGTLAVMLEFWLP